MEESILRKYIIIGVIVLINIILILFTCISVVKSINKIERGEVTINKTEEQELYTNIEETDENQNNEHIIENNSFSISKVFDNIIKGTSFINMKILQQCILLIIGINLAILSIIIFRKLN